MNTTPATIALALIAIASLIAGAIVTTSGADAAALWAIAGTAAGAIGGAVIPSRSTAPAPTPAPSSSATVGPVSMP